MERDPHNVLAVILEEARVRSHKRDPELPLCSTTVASGSQAIYDFGAESCGGTIWTRLVSANVTNSFPAVDDDPNNCAQRVAYHAEVGILRAAALPESTGLDIEVPSDEELFNESRQQLFDMQDMLTGLQAVGAEMDDFMIQSYFPVGPEGGVVGGTWAFVFGEE